MELSGFPKNGIDIDLALGRMNGNRQLLLFSFDEFLRRQAGFGYLFRRALLRESNRELLILAHTLSSQAATLGITKIHYYADLLESSISIDALDGPMVESILIIIEGAINEVKDLQGEIGKYLNKLEDNIVVNNEGESPLLDFVEKLERLDPNVLRVFRSHEGFFDVLFGEDFDKVQRHVENFDFAKAMQLVKKYIA